MSDLKASVAFGRILLKNSPGYHTQYQRMIRRLIDSYVDAYDKPLTNKVRSCEATI